MEEVLHYLELKNQYLEKFHSITKKFLDQVRQDRWDDLELFVDNRERILNIVHSYDFKIANRFSKLDVSPAQLETWRGAVKDLLDTRETIAKKIVALDLELITKMDEIKNETVKELKRTLETSQQINSFAPAEKRSPKPRKDA